MASKKNWDALVDSDDEEALAGGELERATYRVIGENAAIFDAPNANAGVLDLRNRGDHLACDARNGNWVRLQEAFPDRHNSEQRGWAAIDGGDVHGILLQKVVQRAKAAPVPVPSLPVVAPPPAAPLQVSQPLVTAEATSRAALAYSKWDKWLAEVSDDEDDEHNVVERGEPAPGQRDERGKCLKPMNAAAMHHMGYSWSEIRDGPPVPDYRPVDRGR